MKRNLLLICIVAQLVSPIAEAQIHKTIPTYHWAYPYLSELRLRGYLPSLSTIRQPYTETEVANAILILNQQADNVGMAASPNDRWMLDLLSREFLRRDHWTDERLLRIDSGLWLDESVLKDSRGVRFYTQLRSQIGVHWKNRLAFYNGIRLDQSLLDDPLYPGKRWRGFAGYTEQAYVRFSFDDFRKTNIDFSLTLGRDFLNWGAGKTGRLLFSDHAQPLDQLKIDLAYKGIQFYVLAAQLEKWQLSDSLAKMYGTRRANRYISAHGITIAIKNRFFIGLTEALLYGGPDAPWELKYHNPMLYYHGELLNGGGTDGNGFLYLDFDFYPWPNWELYGEILVDDYQLEKKIPIDLEPNEFGFILGGQLARLLGISGSRIGVEYVRIANRTYNSWQEWEKFVHFNRPIGYCLGNNFDRWQVRASQWLWRGCQIDVAWDRIRQGIGSPLARWDTPWLKYTVAEGYHEPFPYGVVETASNLTLIFRYHPRAFLFLESQARYANVKNVDHLLGKNRRGWDFMVNLHLNFGKDWRY
ncbi:MAG: capsule assembly Wzi family protein [candidate division KSB1 bacterium]|nr:capsule assembly Wzi family protein [candidate division KSB1 bacterium]MDZ7335958.1 capsule assembly Wzi family protein [candidate division KSB1 bacterium]MDZ7357924.1 capsule assembly Wzi family protein [candidate division KSB1 bacterium]MDZ7376268.1 capsule assembly Wzi family protein [candidate division KSB1 bacterium]MDZ7402179.1 capsule assembly Wzi family protein [candidate division KSB1 bacterium]